MQNQYNEYCSYLVGELTKLISINAEEFKILLDYFHCRNVSKGVTLWREGDDCDYIAFVASGRVMISKETELKGNPVVLGIYGTGSFIGALCILDNSGRAVTAETLDDTSLMIITKENFDKLMNENPALWGKLLKGILLSVSKRLKSSFERLVTVF
ncbi:MAG: Crp/Fnr family transcriptional regulator [Thermodesulfovibrionia bacterium]|nr:Crp/Fnr family transcriptional regulator [Thermodesulfovibrionia bacterium]